MALELVCVKCGKVTWYGVLHLKDLSTSRYPQVNRLGGLMGDPMSSDTYIGPLANDDRDFLQAQGSPNAMLTLTLGLLLALTLMLI